MRQKTLQQLTEKKYGLGVKSTWKCTVNHVSVPWGQVSHFVWALVSSSKCKRGKGGPANGF